MRSFGSKDLGDVGGLEYCSCATVTLTAVLLLLQRFVSVMSTISYTVD